MTTRRIAPPALLLLLLSCSGSAPPPADGIPQIFQTPGFQEACAELPTCANPRFQPPGPMEEIWRVEVVRGEKGEISFGRIDTVDVPEGDGVPLGPRTGEYILAGLDASGEPVDAQLIQFPSFARVEFADQQALAEEIDLNGTEVNAMGYVRARPSIERLVIQAESGDVLASAETEALRATLQSMSAPGWGFATTASAATRFLGDVGYCSHVVVLDGEADRDLLRFSPIGYTTDIDLVRPGDEQLANTQAALGRMTKLMCQSVSRIAFGTFNLSTSYSGLSIQVGWGDMMLINVAAGYDETTLESSAVDRLDLQRTVIHETGHLVEALLNAEGKSLLGLVYGGDWSDAARDVAKETIDRVRMAKGFGEEWRRVQDSFTSLGWASEYGSVDGSNFTRRDLVSGGFISAYSSTRWFDDIADFIAWTYMGEAYDEEGVSEGRRDYSCAEMQAHSGIDLPSRFAAIYTKLHFLKDLGLVVDTDVEACTGPNLGLPITSEGFEIWQGGSLKRSYTSNVSAGIGTNGIGLKIFTMEAEGTAGFSDATYPAKMTLHLDLESALKPIEEVPWPRGAYEFGSFFDGTRLTLRLDGAPAGDFNAYDGFVIVAEASNERIVGSAVVRKVLRPHAPLPVPQVFDPPLVIRFLMEK